MSADIDQRLIELLSEARIEKRADGSLKMWIPVGAVVFLMAVTFYAAMVWFQFNELKIRVRTNEGRLTELENHIFGRKNNKTYEKNH